MKCEDNEIRGAYIARANIEEFSIVRFFYSAKSLEAREIIFPLHVQQGDIVLTKLRKDDDLKVDIIYKFPKDAGLEALARAKQNNDCTLDDEVNCLYVI